jgi:outer membrane protein TolC
MRRLSTAVWIAALLAGALAAGCVPPGQANLGILEAYQKALVARSPQPREGEAGLGPLTPAPQAGLPALRVTTQPSTQRTQVYLPLEEAIIRALANSPEIRLVSFDPAIAHEKAVEAAAAFDYIVFGSWEHSRQDKQSASTLGGGQITSWTLEGGLKQKTITGANWSLAYTLNGTPENTSPATSLTKYYEPIVSLEVTQPLLRDAWCEATLAEVHLARVNERSSAEAFRQKVEEIVTNVIGAYWALVQARVDLGIQEHLLAVTLETLERTEARAELDATTGQVKQAKAAVESRRAALLVARKTIGDAQDALARLVADPQINLQADVEIIPTTDPVTQEVQVDLTDRLITALKHNPTLTQARLAIEAADINVSLAVNETLPRLDLTASVSQQGLAGAVHQAHENLGTGHYVSYSVGLTAEYPLGNRAALAKLRRERLTLDQTLTNLQNLADQVAADLRERVRQVHTTYQEMLAQRASAEAAGLYLQSLEDIEQIRGRLTPEFLLVKLQAQQDVAAARRAELTAIVHYNIDLADLEKASGTVLQVQPVKIALPPATDMSNWPAPEAPATAPASAPVTVIDAYRQALSGSSEEKK